MTREQMNTQVSQRHTTVRLQVFHTTTQTQIDAFCRTRCYEFSTRHFRSKHLSFNDVATDSSGFQ